MPLNKTELAELLKKEDIAYIATTKSDGTPHIAPIWFIYHKGKIYFETDKKTLKFKNIQALNKVALCFGGKQTYLVEGSVKWYSEQELGFPIRKLFWDKYGKDMDDSYINKDTLLLEVIPNKSMSWHYADLDWE